MGPCQLSAHLQAMPDEHVGIRAGELIGVLLQVSLGRLRVLGTPVTGWWVRSAGTASRVAHHGAPMDCTGTFVAPETGTGAPHTVSPAASKRCKAMMCRVSCVGCCVWRV
jgi:hypothetical protein